MRVVLRVQTTRLIYFSHLETLYTHYKYLSLIIIHHSSNIRSCFPNSKDHLEELDFNYLPFTGLPLLDRPM